jgi:hypothetical protein
LNEGIFKFGADKNAVDTGIAVDISQKYICVIPRENKKPFFSIKTVLVSNKY